MLKTSQLLLAAALFAVALTGCADCGTAGNGGVIKATGEPALECTEANCLLAQDSVTEAVMPFGPALLNDRVEHKITIRNTGRGAFEVASLTRGARPDDSFRSQFEPFTLDVGGVREVSFFFEPTGEGEHAEDVTFDIKSASVTALVVHLSGLGVKGGCVIDPGETADWGSVATGTSFVKLVSVRNNSDLDWRVTIGAISSQSDKDVFAFASGFVPGEYKVAAHDGIVVPIEFKPNHVGPHSAFLSIPAPTMCKPAVLPLVGNGVDQVLTWSPDHVDFGFVNPGSKVLSKVTFRNDGNKDVTVSGLAVVNPPSKDAFALEATTFTVLVAKNGGTAAVPVSFRPTLLGAAAADLKFLSDDAKLSAGTIKLQGFGGGPDIDVAPGKVDFGPVALGSQQSRRITIANVGTDAPGTSKDNLLLGELDALTGLMKPRPPTLVDASGEFILEPTSVAAFPQPGLGAGQNHDLKVTFKPKSAGQKTAKLTIYSNDPDEPSVEVTILAGAKTFPPCDYEIVPPQLKFGNVENGKNITLSFFIRNRATNPAEECLISTLDVVSSTSGAAGTKAFTLVNGPLSQVTLPGGGQLEVPVRFAPRADGSYSGSVEFYLSSLVAPEGKVTLSGGSQAGCLLVAPNDLDFGVVQTLCSSRDRTFTLYNVCSTTITLNTIDVQAGLSTEFRITQKPPGIPGYALKSGDSVDFKASYRPIDVGQDAGSIAIQTAQLTQPYVVTIIGRGATTAIQTDVFAQDSQPKVDVLIVIDDSGSMYDKQQALAKNFASFIKFAVSQQVDYRIATTTTDICSSTPSCFATSSNDTENGRFFPVAGGRPRIITPNTPNKETVFTQNVNVGTNGSGTEQLLAGAYLALSNPNITNSNAGFLRDEAHLAIIIVSDAEDQSPNTVAFYYNFFLTIKGFRRANMMSVSGIIPTLVAAPSGCSYDGSSSGQSTRTREVVTRTGGVYDDICTPDWAKTLEKLGQTAFGYRTRFFLTNQPDLSITPVPIDVKVDGVAYPEVGPRGDTRWVYNSTANAIDFEPLAVPEPGTTLTVTYHVACLP